MSLRDDISAMAKRARKASRSMAKLTAVEKNTCLKIMADALNAGKDAIRKANDKDIEAAEVLGLSEPMVDRLLLDESRINGMANGLREVAELPDPVGRVVEHRELPTGLKLTKVKAPIGVIVIIYESRPNVTADAAGLCFKSGNATILRGGKEAINSNQIITQIMVEAASKALPSFSSDAIQVVPTADRAAIPELLSLTSEVDLCIPRGGESLIRAVTECSKVPVIKHYKGVCHVYIDGAADLAMAEEVTLNSKAQRPGVCNAAETLLVDREIADKALPKVAIRLLAAGVELCGDNAVQKILSGSGIEIAPASNEDWSEEYLALKLSLKVVDGVEDAIEHINQYGSGHTDAIITASEKNARRFQLEVDSSTVFWNASTRFTDGAQFGMGAEIGISTDKIGARGPMGLDELTSYKWLGEANGLIRS